MGSKQAGFEICETLAEKLPKGVFCAIICPDDSSDQRSEMAQFIRLAKLNAITFRVVKNVVETKEIIKNINPAVALVHGWYQIIPVAELANKLFLAFIIHHFQNIEVTLRLCGRSSVLKSRDSPLLMPVGLRAKAMNL